MTTDTTNTQATPTMPPVPTFESGWEGFAKVAFGPEVSDQQRYDMRVAFFSGAIRFMAMQIKLGDAKVPEDVYIAAMNGWEQEFSAFMQDLEGRAVARAMAANVKGPEDDSSVVPNGSD